MRQSEMAPGSAAPERAKHYCRHAVAFGAERRHGWRAVLRRPPRQIAADAVAADIMRLRHIFAAMPPIRLPALTPHIPCDAAR